MKLKQKIATIVVSAGLMGGLFTVGPAHVVLAQSASGQQDAASQADETADSTEGDTSTDTETCVAGGDFKCCGNVKTSIVGGKICETAKGEDVIMSLLKGVLRIMTAGVGIAAVGGIAYAAFLYTTAEDKAEQTKKAISMITNVVIGIVSFGLMVAALNFIVPGGVFK